MVSQPCVSRERSLRGLIPLQGSALSLVLGKGMVVLALFGVAHQLKLPYVVYGFMRLLPRLLHWFARYC